MDIFGPMIRVSKPTIILDKERCMANINRMVDKAKKSNVQFRPHFKTHQSAYIGNWFRKLGIHAITVSSASMAKYFCAYGWRDITIAFPVNLPELPLISELASEVSLTLITDNKDVIPALEGAINTPVSIFVEIDTGYHRTGISWKDVSLIDEVLETLANSQKLKFKGFLTHSGHTYHADTTDEIVEIYKDTVRKLNDLKQRYSEVWPDLKISIGDTPSCSIVETFEGIDEIRPGNFVFYDLMQYSLGSCNLKDIAVAVACPVVSKSHRRNELVIYGGAVHFSKEFLYKSNGERIYGYVVKIGDREWGDPLRGTYLANLSQEHGIIQTTRDIFETINVGDIIGILPVHSCLVASALKGYQTLNGEVIGY